MERTEALASGQTTRLEARPCMERAPGVANARSALTRIWTQGGCAARSGGLFPWRVIFDA